MQANRREFLTSAGLLVAGSVVSRSAFAVGSASQIQVSQLVYAGGNWRPRATALRRLAWEVHKRTAVNAALEPAEVKASTRGLANTPVLYMSGDRPFPDWSEVAVKSMGRFIKLGGTLIVDPALTPGGDADGFDKSVDTLLNKALPRATRNDIPPNHVIFRSFYRVTRPVGRVQGPKVLTGHAVGDRFAVIRTKHDLGGAWARDNLGNWEFDVVPGGERQREDAFRLGINFVLYCLLLNYKNEEPHRRFNRQVMED